MNALSSASVDPAIHLQFDDNRLLSQLFGEHDKHLARIEKQLGVTVIGRGNRLTIAGPEDASGTARVVLESLYQRLRNGQGVGEAEVDAAIRMANSTDSATPGVSIQLRRKSVHPRSAAQGHYIDALNQHDLIFALGPAGTGKTYLAVCAAVSMFSQGLVDRIVLSRPAVEAGERLGFLPGDLREKVDPYLRPLYDALNDAMSAEQVAKRLESGEIEIAPLAFMRGRTLANAYVILDEAQNTTPMQMKMFLTRLGENSRMVVTGDLSQIDLPGGVGSGLRDAVNTLKDVDGAAFVHFSDKDVVRPPLVARIIRAYDAADGRKKKPGGSE
ncbi:MAG: PhoH family protein [Rhodospirillaceae bacterium]|nr:PhoH family protein [Rhodospirillaceae bacterium]MBT5667751.1 PhoH family protein [Rhodospirillaceae bacterium]MBT5811433.1 PhoH family protein [Rhodospirillaceae bacterium]